MAVLPMILACAGVLGAETYFVSPSGSDGNAGTTQTAAFATINKAAEIAAAGDTVNVLPGTYEGKIRPANSGTAGNPIVYRAHGDGTVEITVPTDGGSWYDKAAFALSDKHYTVIDGFRFYDCETWFYIGEGGSHNVVRNCEFERCRIYHGSMINSGSYNTVFHCTYIEGTESGLCDALAIWRDSHYNLVEHCTFGKILHDACSVMAYEAQYNPSRNIVRKCHFEDVEHRGVSANSGQYTLIEDCTFTGEAGELVRLSHPNIIVRNNVLYRQTAENGTSDRAWNAMILVRSHYDEYGSENADRFNRVYHNVFYDNDIFSAVTMRTPEIDMEDNVYKNNIFYKNAMTVYIPEAFDHAEDFLMVNNAIYGNAAGGITAMKMGGYVYTLDAAQANLPDFFRDNIEVEPAFVDEEGNDFRIRPTSPCVDAGADLTVTASAGSGTEVPVEDALYFCDGFGVIDGDTLVIGGDTVIVIAVDYDTDVLTVDRSISWGAGDPVNLPYTGDGPDIGAFPADRSSGIRPVGEVHIGMTGIRGRLFDLSGRSVHPGIVHGPGVFLYRVPDTGEMRKVLSRP